jgi:glutamyl-tRNA synthetase
MSQSDRLEVYADVLSNLIGDGHTYECFCSRREIREAPTAPHTHLPDGAYPGTCRSLTASERSDRAATGRPPALRLRADEAVVTVPDLQLGDYTGVVDDVVLRRGDGTPAYNLVVVIDDDAQGVTQVVRGDDLLPSTPRQVHLTRLLNLTVPEYAHVPLVVASDGRRLAKRFGAVTMADRIALGETPLDVLNTMLRSLGLAEVAHIDELHDVAAVFDRSRLPREPWEYHPTG